MWAAALLIPAAHAAVHAAAAAAPPPLPPPFSVAGLEVQLTATQSIFSLVVGGCASPAAALPPHIDCHPIRAGCPAGTGRGWQRSNRLVAAAGSKCRRTARTSPSGSATSASARGRSPPRMPRRSRPCRVGRQQRPRRYTRCQLASWPPVRSRTAPGYPRLVGRVARTRPFRAHAEPPPGLFVAAEPAGFHGSGLRGGCRRAASPAWRARGRMEGRGRVQKAGRRQESSTEILRWRSPPSRRPMPARCALCITLRSVNRPQRWEGCGPVAGAALLAIGETGIFC